MRIVIVGIGDVGWYLCAVLSGSGHDVTAVDVDAQRLASLDRESNVRTLHGSGSSAGIIREAIAKGCDAFIAMTRIDEVNLIATSLAKAMGAKKAVARIHDQTIIDNCHLNYSLHFGVDLLLNPEGLCASALAMAIRNPARVSVEQLVRGQIEAQRFIVEPASKAVGKALRDVKLPPMVRFGYLERADFQDVPSASSILAAGDRITVFGPPDKLPEVQALLQANRETKPIKVVIFGGSETAVALIRLLAHPRFKIRVIEQNRDKIRLLSDRFQQVTFIQGDGTSARLLAEEQVADADFFVASTSDDERNIMTCMQAVALGTRKVQAVLNKSDYEDILVGMQDLLRIDSFVSPRKVTAAEVLRYISTERFVELFRFPDQEARIIETVVPLDSPCSGMQLGQLHWPSNAVIIGLIHQFKVKVPAADDLIIAGDRLLIITRAEKISSVMRLLGGT